MSNIRTIHDYSRVPTNPYSLRGQSSISSLSSYELDDYGDNVVGEASLVTVPASEGFWGLIMPRATTRSFTFIISVIQALMFAATLIVGAAYFGGAFVASNYGGGPSTAALNAMGAKNTDLIKQGEVYRLVLPVLLHASVIHFLSNMFFQLRFCFTLEQRWGTNSFIAVYVSAGVFASLLSAVWSPHAISVGASGALFGVLAGDFAYVMLNYRKIRHAGQELIMVAVVLGLNFLLGLAPGIDNNAHLGGTVGGVLVCVVLLPYTREEASLRVVAGLILTFVLAWLLVELFVPKLLHAS